MNPPGAEPALFDDVESLKAAISINLAAGQRHSFERIAADAMVNACLDNKELD